MKGRERGYQTGCADCPFVAVSSLPGQLPLSSPHVATITPNGHPRRVRRPRRPPSSPVPGRPCRWGRRPRSAARSRRPPLRIPPAERDRRPSAGPSGCTWGSADVQVCTLADAKANVTVDWKTWSLRYADNSVVAAGDKNDDAFPRPEYPFTSRPLAGGQCVRGWITFSVPASSKPIAVEYQPHGFVASWAVPAYRPNAPGTPREIGAGSHPRAAAPGPAGRCGAGGRSACRTPNARWRRPPARA